MEFLELPSDKNHLNFAFCILHSALKYILSSHCKQTNDYNKFYIRRTFLCLKKR